LFVVGNSLSALSGLRFVREAYRLDKPIAAINLGQTRGDELFSVKATAACDAALPRLLEGLRGTRRARAVGRSGAAIQLLL
jgi:hypothetical protein